MECDEAKKVARCEAQLCQKLTGDGQLHVGALHMHTGTASDMEGRSPCKVTVASSTAANEQPIPRR